MSWLLASLLGCAPCELSLAVDRASDGWERSVEAVRANFEADGTCPDAPPEPVVMRNGCAYGADVVTLDAAVGFFYAELSRWPASAGTERRVDLQLSPEAGDVACEDEVVYNAPGAGLHVELSSRETTDAGAPLFLTAAGADSSLDVWRDIQLSEIDWARASADGSYAWLCLEAAPGPATIADLAPADWRGALFVHADALEDAPLDLFLPLDGVACAWGEDASTRYGYRDGEPYFPGQCDGFDNDADGVTDEGAADRDGDGVADCLEPVAD
ncbi:MAG: hypothetical protein Q8P41_08745 [Pseudomonadota bacterium]|nr:hypothetical protein [Pseudomonadota bacterium]